MSDLLHRQFDRIGARLKLHRDGRRLRPRFAEIRRRAQIPFRLDIAKDDKGEYFDLTVGAAPPDFRVLQANGAARHLLLHATGDDGGERFLCGHDERHWFVAAVADRVSTISDARRSLLPRELRHLANMSPGELAKRRTDHYVRQGEWFFVPTDRIFAEALIHHGEPLQRGTRNKPHIVAELVRFGGTDVVLHGNQEYSAAEWDEKIKNEPNFLKRAGRVERRRKNPEVYVRGAVRHADHATLTLDVWHRVYLNGEIVSSNVAFYD